MNRVVCLRAFAGAGVSQALAASSPTIPAKVSCASLAADPDFVTIRGNPTAIASATDVPAADRNPAYRDVKGMIAPQTHFELKLPESTWQGRYLQNGCGGYCGNVPNQNFPGCDATLGGDFAMAADEEGHTSSGGLGGGGLFAFNSSKLRKVYGYQSEQSLYVVARAVIRAYYGQKPNSSYHCGGGYGGVSATNLDMTLQLVQWVKNGVAPTEVDVTYPDQAVTRPAYPYPRVPRDDGSGDPEEPSSFHPVVAPAHARHTDYRHWIGDYLFDQPIDRGSGRRVHGRSEEGGRR